MDKYLTALNRNEVRLGYLTKAKNVEVRERLNGESLISFEIPYDSYDATLLELEGFIKFNGQLFVIKAIDPSQNDKRRLTVRAVHVYIELVDEFIDKEIELFGNLDGTLQNAVNEVLRDTHFTVGTVTGTDVHDFHIYEVSSLKGLQEIAELWNVDIWFDNRTVHVGRRGAYRNVELRYGKNLKSLNMPTSSENIITRLYVYGKDGLTIEGINNGIKYLDSPNIGNYKRPKCGEVRFNDIDDPQELLEKGQQHLEKVDKPEVSYQADFHYLSRLGYDVYDEVLTGDELIITHAPFGLSRLPLRVVEYSYRPFEPTVGSVTLSNTKDSLVDILVQLARSKNTVAKALDKNGRIQSNKLDLAIQQATQAIMNAQTELEFTENFGIIARDPTNPNQFVMYNSAGLGITTDGTNFDEAITPFGINASVITTGELNASLVKILNGNGVTVDASGLKVMDTANIIRGSFGEYAPGKYGVKLTNGEIYGTTIRSGVEGATNYVELSGNGSEPLRVVANNNDALNVGTYGNGGSVQFYDYSVGDMRGQIYPHNDAMGNGLRIHARNNSGSSLPLHLWGSWIPIDGDVTVYDGLSVLGNKNALHITPTYGGVYLATRESPEFRFIDEGTGELINGECRIYLDPIFLECIEPNTAENKWHIHCTPCKNMNLYLAYVGEDHFIINDSTGSANGTFSWTLSGVRKGFTERFRREDDSVLTSNWEDEILV